MKVTGEIYIQSLGLVNNKIWMHRSLRDTTTPPPMCSSWSTSEPRRSKHDMEHVVRYSYNDEKLLILLHVRKSFYVWLKNNLASNSSKTQQLNVETVLVS